MHCVKNLVAAARCVALTPHTFFCCCRTVHQQNTNLLAKWIEAWYDALHCAGCGLWVGQLAWRFPNAQAPMHAVLTAHTSALRTSNHNTCARQVLGKRKVYMP